MSQRRAAWGRRLDRYRGVLALLVVVLLGVVASPHDFQGQLVFAKRSVHLNMLRVVAEFGVLAAGMTLVILTGGIDLSVGSVLAAAGMVCAHLLIRAHWWPVAALLVGVGTGLLIGLANGLLISRLAMQPFVATLATMVAARGLAKWVSDSEKIMTELVLMPDGTAVRQDPRLFDQLGGRLPQSEIFVVTLIFLVVILIGWFLLSQTAFGRALYAIGGNEEASRLSGIRVRRLKTLAYAICGALAGLAGVLHVCQVRQGDPDAGQMYELDAIAAVVIGGTSLAGGRGGMLLTLIGVLIIGYIDQILSLNNVQYPKRLVTKGAIIVAAVLIQQRRKRL